MPKPRLRFLLKATYDTLQCPRNLTLWFGVEVGCLLCGNSKVRLQHILLGWKVALAQGRFRWHHDHVLAKMAEVL